MKAVSRRSTTPELVRQARQSAAAYRALYDRHVVRPHGFLLRRTETSR
jgi:hypothetical protein